PGVSGVGRPPAGAARQGWDCVPECRQARHGLYRGQRRPRVDRRGWPAFVEKSLQRPVVFLNDADAAGVSEGKWGAGRGIQGVVIMLTFGTGIGTALFADGKLLPNSELGHMEVQGMEAEKWTSAHVRTAQKLDWPAWIERVNVYLAQMYALLWPDLFILGG